MRWSLLIPFIWSNCKEIGLFSHSVNPHIAHLYSNAPSLINLFFKEAILAYEEFSTNISSNEYFA